MASAGQEEPFSRLALAVWWALRCWKRFYASDCWQELHFEFYRQKFEQKCAEPFCVLMTHHTAKANLEKGSSWPPEAIPYCHSFCVTFYFPKTPNLHLGSDHNKKWDLYPFSPFNGATDDPYMIMIQDIVHADVQKSIISNQANHLKMSHYGVTLVEAIFWKRTLHA